MIGLIGGMSWRSTELYHRRLNEAAEARGGLHANAPAVIVSMRYADLLGAGRAGDWAHVETMIAKAIQQAAAAGATLGILTAVTPHRLFDTLSERSPIPLLHVLDPAINALRLAGLFRIGVLGTSYTLDADAFSSKFAAAGLRVIRPSAEQLHAIDTVIQTELTAGLVTEASKRHIMNIASDLARQDAEAILLACTELPLLEWCSFKDVPVVDAVKLHVEAALETFE